MKTRRSSRSGLFRWAPAPVAALIFALAFPASAADPTNGRVLTLTDIETLVLDANHDIRLARLAVDGAQAGILQADVRPNPTLSYNAASYNPRFGLGGGNPFDKRVDQIVRLDQTFERGDKRALRIALAEKQLAGRRLDLQEQRRETLQMVRNAYIDLLLAEKRIEVLAETQRAYESSLDAAGKRVRGGDLAAADLARLKVEVLRARTDGDAATSDRLHAQTALAVLLDLPDDPRSLSTDGEWSGVIASHPAGLTGDIEQRPDVASAKLAVAAAATSIDLARSQRVRDITIGVQVERYPGFGGTGNTIGVGASIPLFIGNDYRGDIAHAASDRDVAEETAAKVRAAALADAANARADLETAERKVRTYREGLLDAAQSAARSADFAFDRGALGVMDLMDARRTLLSTRLDALGAEADFARARIAIDAVSTRVTGGVGR